MKVSSRVALAACVALGAIVPASATHSWGGYHWAGNGTNLTLKLNRAITSQWSSYVTEATADWEQSAELTLNSATVSVNARKCNPITGQVLICNESYGQRGWLGIANIWLSNGHISKATVKLNDTYFNQAQYNTAPWRNVVSCQEIGHTFGLDHVDEAFGNPNQGTCMDYTNDPDGGGAYGPSNEHPNSHDYSMLTTIYNHDDGFTTATAATNFGIRQVGAAPPQADAGAGDSPAEWGRAIHRDGQGRPDLFVRELGPGRKVLTHVFWAIGKGPQ